MTTHQGETGGDVGTVELRGKVKWFNAVKGYGFLALDIDNSDAFLHVTTLRQAGHEDLSPVQLWCAPASAVRKAGRS